MYPSHAFDLCSLHECPESPQRVAPRLDHDFSSTELRAFWEKHLSGVVGDLPSSGASGKAALRGKFKLDPKARWVLVRGRGRECPGSRMCRSPRTLQRQRGECILARESEEEGTVPAHAGSSGQDENVLLVKHDDGFWSRCEQQALLRSSGLAPLSAFSGVNIQHSTARRP